MEVEADAVERTIFNADEDSLTLDLPAELSGSSEEEEFLSNGCGCGRNCVRTFSRTEILESRWGCFELNTTCEQHVNHLNIALRGALNAISRVGEMTNQIRHRRQERQEAYTVYQFHGLPVCRRVFSICLRNR